MEQTKKCFKCGIEKPLSDFYKHPRMADGHLNKCKECTKKDRREHEENHPDAVLQARIKQCAKKPTQTNAYRVVEAAIKAGILVKPDACSICGCNKDEHRIEAHHYDYTKPLDVIWLCSSCHGKADALRRAYEGKPAIPQAKPVEMVSNGVVACRFESINAASKQTGIPATTLKNCLYGNRAACNGFEWRYAT